MSINKDAWSALSMTEIASLINIYVKGGVLDLKKMKEHYNRFGNGGRILDGKSEKNQTLSNIPTREMTPSEAAALNKTLYNSQYMLAVGASPDDPAYLSTDVLEPAVVKAFKSVEDYNRHQGERFGEYVSDEISKAGTKLAPVLVGTAVAPWAIQGGIAAYSNPFIRTGLDIVGSIDGIRNAFSDNGVRKTIRLAKEGDTLGAIKSGVGDVFDIAGTTDLIRIGSRFNKANRALHAFDVISPEGYDNPGKKFKTWFSDIVNNKPVDIDNPQWRIEDDGYFGGHLYLRDTSSNRDAAAKIYREARIDAWRMYNGLPQKYGTYLKNADGTYSYDLDRIKKIDSNFRPNLRNEFDDITGAGGGLTYDDYKLIGEGLQNEKFYVRTIEDIWDLHPFSRRSDRLNAKVNNYLSDKIGTQKFRDAAQNFRSYMYKKGHWDHAPKTLLGKATKFLDDPLNWYTMGYRSDGQTIFPTIADNLIDKFTDSKFMTKISDKLANVEAGTIIGGTPFEMHTKIPITGRPIELQVGNGTASFLTTELGFPSDDVLPWEVKNYNLYDFDLPNLEKDNFILPKDGYVTDKIKRKALGGPLYNKYNPIESFSGSSKIPVVRTGVNLYGDGGDKDNYIENYNIFNTGGPTEEKYNIFEDELSFKNRDNHRKSLEDFVKQNPTIGGINTADFVEFFNQLSGLESSYRKDAGEGMRYSGYYGLEGGRNYDENTQHQKAYEHLARLFKNSIVKEDLARGIKLGFTPAQILTKYWNQGNRVTNYLYNGKDDNDDAGSLISEYGWNMTADVDYSKYLPQGITDDYVIIKDWRTLGKTIPLVRNSYINYSDRENSIIDLNTRIKRSRTGNPKAVFDPTRLQVNDTVWLKPIPLKK